MSSKQSNENIKSFKNLKGVLKQRLRCLHASLEERLFVQPQIKQNTNDDNLLILSATNSLDTMGPGADLTKSQTQIYIQQHLTEALSTVVNLGLINWEYDVEAHVNPEDTYAADETIKVLLSIMNSRESTDLTKYFLWKSCISSMKLNSVKQSSRRLKSWLKKYKLDEKCLKKAQKAFLLAASILDSLEKTNIGSDGCTLTIILEGKVDHRGNYPELVQRVICAVESHTIIFNRIDSERTQIAISWNISKRTKSGLQGILLINSKNNATTDATSIKEVS